jgi:putative membrane protein
MRKGDPRKAVIFIAALAALPFNSGLIQARAPEATEANRTFVKEAIQSDLAEIQIGKLAQEKSASEKVKQFGRRLESDHGANLEKAGALAKSLGVTTLPTGPNANQKATYDKLSRLSGTQFDRRFARKMMQDHKKDIKAFQQESRKSGPASDFAKQTLPTLEEHLQIAKSLGGSTMWFGR